MGNYVVYHAHTDYSNPTTVLDSTTKVEDYVQATKDAGMKALGISEHGNVFEWTRKKKLIENAGMKYIHATEAYVTETLKEKIRDNYHVVLIALNEKGVNEINYLMSHEVASNRDDGHFYYSPRITFEELINTSNNIAITTACLGGILNNGSIELQKEFLKFAIKNKHRVFLEIQHHDVDDQIEYNKKLYAISEKTGLRLIAGTDTHSLNEEQAIGRTVLQKSKNVYFENEEGWDLTFKTYDELIDAYKKQNSLPMDVIKTAINNTNVLTDMVDEFELDVSFKYPKLHKNSTQVFIDKIKEGFENRDIIPDEEKLDRIKEEIKVYNDLGVIDYMLLEEELKKYCRKEGIPYGYGRGSVTGSYVAYLMQVTQMDSIKHNLIFQRFLNPERVTLADIDTDYPSSRREDVKDYLYNRDGLHCTEIITFNTIAVKGAIRDVGRALDIPLDTVDKITKEIVLDNKGRIVECSTNKQLMEKHPKLFKYAKQLIGVIVSIGYHPAGTLVSPHPVSDQLGTYIPRANGRPVAQVDMKEVENLGYVKLDILGLDNLEVIYNTSKMAGIPMPTPDTLDTEDENVWKSMRDSTAMVFQWESDTAFSYFKQLFSDDTLEKIKKQNPNVSYMDLLSIGNAAIRPAGDSYRDDLAAGKVLDHGHDALNELLSNTNGYCVYQEQIIEFLNKFCGFDMGKADIVRRAFTGGGDTSVFMPQIEAGFIKTMKEEYNTDEEEARRILDSFMKVIIDASNYLFSINHSEPYSYTGYASAYLRYYYPLEFLTASFDTFQDDATKTAEIYQYMTEHTNIKMKPIKFRYARANYSFDRDTNTIYKGMSSIKYMNKTVSEELYELRDNQYDSFVDLLVDIVEGTSANSRQIKILIALDYFSEFGNPGQLMAIYNEFNDGKNKYKKTYVDATKEKRITALKEHENDVEYTPATIADIVKAEKKYIGHISIVDERFKPNVALVSDLNINRWGTAFATLYRLNNGETEEVKIRGNVFENNPFKEMDLIQTITLNHEYKRRKDKNGKWYNTGETEPILSSYRIVEQG